MAKNFIEFRGRNPDVKFLLLDNGIDFNDNNNKKFFKK